MGVDKTRSKRVGAVGQALLVTFLWSTSWVLIKLGLDDIPAITFAGLRYTLAFLVLLPFALRRRHIATLGQLSKGIWLQLIVLGLLFYAITQGAQFLGLTYLPAITVNLLLSFTIIVVVVLGIWTLGERPTRDQWLGMIVFLAGVSIFFYPPVFPQEQTIGIIIVLGGVLANAVSSILGRNLNRDKRIPPTVITVITMGIGGIALLIAGLVIQGLPELSLLNWGIIAWLAVVNSAFAFTLWNHTLRTLSAMESSIINNTMMIQIPILAWVFLDEDPSALEITGMVLAGVGILIVQLRWRRAPEEG
jgi:drug/metabolite transporter (DMT)-like permease